MAETKKYLDYEGLQSLWAKIKAADQVNADAISEVSEKVSGLETSVKDLDDLVIGANDSITNIQSEITNINKQIENVNKITPIDDVKYVDGWVKLYNGSTPVGEGFDASAFIMDGMLADIEVVEATEEAPINEQTSGKFIKYTWNASAGSKVLYLAVSDFSADSSKVTELDSKVTELDSKVTELDGKVTKNSSDISAIQSQLENLAPSPETIVYANITKDESTGEYVTDNAERSALSQGVVDALNELAGELKSIDLSGYYTKEEVDELIVPMEAITQEEIEELV